MYLWRSGPLGCFEPLALANAYKANEIAADTKYKGKTLRVTGVVMGITKDFLDNPQVEIRTDNEFMGLQCSFRKSDQGKLAALC